MPRPKNSKNLYSLVVEGVELHEVRTGSWDDITTHIMGLAKGEKYRVFRGEPMELEVIATVRVVGAPKRGRKPKVQADGEANGTTTRKRREATTDATA